MFYAAVLDKKPVALKARLGVIAPPGAVEAALEPDLR
jgi:hypothetical protein